MWKKRQRSLLAEVSGKPTVRPCQEVICPIEVTVSHLKYSFFPKHLSPHSQPALGDLNRSRDTVVLPETSGGNDPCLFYFIFFLHLG